MAFARAHSRPVVGAVATLGVDQRTTFIRKTYAHLAGAIGLFVLFEYLFLQTAMAARFTEWVVFGSRFNWLLVLGLFMVGGVVAEKWARSSTSKTVQYIGLGAYIALETVFFAPLLGIVVYVLDAPDLISKAAVITLMVFGGLTAIVFLTKKDFSFLRGALSVCAMVAFGLIALSIVVGFTLGTLFAGAMVLLASGFILYYTSQVKSHYKPTQYVAASLALFSAIALLFWYVLQIVISFSGE